MAKEILMPKLGMTMETGTIMQWFKKEGDTVEAGEVLLEVMTDKINIEVEAYESGVLLKTYYDEDDVVPVNQIIGYIGQPNEKVPDQPPVMDSQKSSVEKEEEPLPQEKTEESSKSFDKPRATPAARKWAREYGIHLEDVPGSGPRGRIHVEDVQKYVKEHLQKQEQPSDREVIQPVQSRTSVTGMRKVIGERMVQSVQQAPHVTLHTEVDMKQSVELREQLLPLIEEKTSFRLSYTEIILKAVAIILKQHPLLNASMVNDEIVIHDQINIGLAVSHPDGLLVPVLRQVDQLGLAALTKESKQIAQKARSGQLSPDELQGGTFTVSNLGMYAVDEFTPIINLPETAILGVGRIQEKPVGVDGEIVLRPMMSLSLSFDHRVIDGAPAAAFLTDLKSTLEKPFQLLV